MQCLDHKAGILSGCHRPSYHHARKQVKDHRQIEPAFRRPNVGGIGYPFGVRLIGVEVPLKQIGSHLCAWIAVRGDRAMTRLAGRQSLFMHQTSDSLARTADPLCLQFGMHPWTAIDPSIGLESDLDLFGQVGIFSAVLTGRALAPGIVPAHRHLQHSAHRRNRILVPMLRNERIAHCGPRERARRPHPSDLVQAMFRPYNLDKQGIPARLLDTRVEHSVDVYENRLVNVYVRLVDLRLWRLQSIVESGSNITLAGQVQQLRATLDHARRKATFLDDVTLPAYLPTQTTMVLLKRPAYHAALQGYLEFHQSPGVYLDEPALETPLVNLPFLYQVWGTLEALSVLLDLTGTLGYEVKSQQLAKRDANGIFIRLLPDGKSVLVLQHPTTGTIIKVIPERTYSADGEFRSVSFSQRPDIAIETFPSHSIPSIYLFDPKYKLDSERREEGPGNGRPKKEDIAKMHTYRDAIRDTEQRRVVRYAAILYPGPSQSYSNGIEALQALPDSRAVLEGRLKEIFTDALLV
jgi:hypothetical protein